MAELYMTFICFSNFELCLWIIHERILLKIANLSAGRNSKMNPDVMSGG